MLKVFNSSSSREIIKKINNAMLLICALVLMVGYLSTYKSYQGETITEEITPVTVDTAEDGTKTYTFDLSGYGSQYSGLMFYTSHQIVEAYDELGDTIYEFNITGGFWGSTPGSLYNFVDLDESMNEITIVVTPVYEEVIDSKMTFYIGSSYAMYDELLSESMPKFLTSILIVIFSVLLFVFYAVMHKKLNLAKELIYLAYFSLFSGVWCINETDVSSLIVSNRIMDSLVPYWSLMLMVPPFVLFFDSYIGIKAKKVRNIIIGFSMGQFALCTLLHFTKQAEYRQMLPIMQLMLVVSAIYVVVGVVGQVLRKNYGRNIRICTVGLSLFLVAIIADLHNYYTSTGDADKFGRYAFLIFDILLGWDLIKNTYDIIENGRRAKQMEVFALTDSMTGLLNRNAFEKQAVSDDTLEGVIAIVADANGLKQCNDTYGHEAGDEYITLVAKIFNDVFGKYGNCYRTGGDEFCCIINAGKNINIDRLKRLFTTKVQTAKVEGNYAYDIGVAVGAVMYDERIDEDFRGLVKRADADMYINKKESKRA